MGGLGASKIQYDVVNANLLTGELKEQELEKICTKCKEAKKLSKFDKDKHKYKSIGYIYYCKKCRSLQKNKGLRIGNLKAKEYRNKGLKFCNLCQTAKPFSEFDKNKSNKHGISSYCKICRINRNSSRENKKKMRETEKKYYTKNSKKIVENYKVYRVLNKEKVQKANAKCKSANAKFSWFYEKLNFAEDISYDKDDNLIVKCTYCNKDFIPTYDMAYRRYSGLLGLYSGEGRFYCSKNCKVACPIYDVRKYPRGFKVATSREVSAEFRQMALKNHNYMCQTCNSTENGLHVHHIDGVMQSPITQLDIENVRVLCKSCHVKVHMKPGCANMDYQCNNI